MSTGGAVSWPNKLMDKPSCVSKVLPASVPQSSAPFHSVYLKPFFFPFASVSLSLLDFELTVSFAMDKTCAALQAALGSDKVPVSGKRRIRRSAYVVF